MRAALLLVAVLCCAGALALSGPHRLRQKLRGASAEPKEHDHEARAARIMSELEAGDSRTLDTLERSVDLQLEHTKRELAKVTDFRNRATALLRSQLAEWASGGADNSPEAIKARALLQQSDQLQSKAAADDAADAADAEENASDAEVEARALAEGEAAAAEEDDSAAEEADDSDSGSGDATDADASDDADEDEQSPVDELIALDEQELSTRQAIADSAQRFAAVRLARVEAGASESEVDAQLDAAVSALKLNLSAVHDKRAVLLRHTRLHPSALLRVGAHKSHRHDLLRSDRDRLLQQLQTAAVVYTDADVAAGATGAADPAAEHMRALGAAAGHGAVAKQAVAAWISLIEAELADSA